MSKISLEPNDSGAGTFTLAAPNSNTNRTLTLPDESGTVATIENIPPGYEDQDALDLFNVTGSAPVYACRAWVNFDGTGTVAIRESGNVSSVTDVGSNSYKINFTTPMPDTNYSYAGMPRSGSSSFDVFLTGLFEVAESVNSFTLVTVNSAGNGVNPEVVSFQVFR